MGRGLEARVALVGALGERPNGGLKVVVAFVGASGEEPPSGDTGGF